MRTKLTTILTLLLYSMTIMAQEEFTLEDLNFGGVNYRKYTPENRQLAWWGDELIHVEGEQCSVVDKATGDEAPLFTLDELQAALAAATTAPTVGSLLGCSFPYDDEALCYVADGKAQALFDFKTKEIVWSTSTAGAAHLDWNARSRATACVVDNQLVVIDGDGNSRQLTTDGDSLDIIYGQAVHRNEWGIRSGTFWSPRGDKLAFYRMDQSMVSVYPQVNISPAEGVIASMEPDKYPMTGGVSHVVTVGVYDLSTRQTIYLQTAEPKDRYFTNIAWSPDESTIYMFELNREQNDCQLTAYDSGTGALRKVVYRETDNCYVEPLNPIVFLPWDAKKFVMQSQKDGYNHLYLFDTDGKELKQLTRGEWVVMELMGFDERRKAIVYASNEASTLQRNVWKVDVGTGRRTLLGAAEGWHYGLASTSGAFVVDNYSAPTTPRKIDIIDSRTAKVTSYFAADDPWAGHRQPLFRAGTLLAADGRTPLNYRMVLPDNFDETKSYPTVVYVYGGPHAHCVDASWHYGSRSWETYMAQKGYILFILDNRGGENRGKAFEQVTFHRLGQEEMKDQMEGVAFLKSLPYVDAERLGIHGWSYGGYMTVSLMTTETDVFKVGVAGGPVIDWRFYEVMYGERYMGTPASNAEGYAATSLLGKAEALRGKLQIIIGYDDDTVVPQNALSFLAECIEKNVQVDFFVYPHEGHNMRGHKSVHLHERITQYFEDYLKENKR